MPILEKDDYLEPTCPLCMDQSDVRPVPVGRIIEKLDEHLGRNDYAAAERHLRYWLAEAEQGQDLRGQLSLSNELMGLYRKLGREEDSLAFVARALDLLPRAEEPDSVTAGTTWVNAATVYKAFGQAEKALPYYEKAQQVYEARLSEEDPRRGGLYNNMALALTDLGRFSDARAAYAQALAVMAHVPHGAWDQAITELNLADLAAAELGLLEGEREIEDRLDRAWTLLDCPRGDWNGYYAFVCEKCAPSFTYFGRFADGEALKQRAEEIYAGT